MLDRKRKSGLHLIFAHHHFKQFEDGGILNSVEGNISTKVMFEMNSDSERMEMLRTMSVGGRINEANNEYAKIPRQYAFIKVPGQDSLLVRTPDVESYFAPNLDQYIRERLDAPQTKSGFDLLSG